MTQPRAKEKQEKEMKNNSMILAANAAIQFFAFAAYTQFAILWPYYIVIALLSLLIFIQTFGIAVMISDFVQKDTNAEQVNDNKMSFLLHVFYMVSCYQLYAIGYTIFAVVAFTHITIGMLSTILRSIKK